MQTPNPIPEGERLVGMFIADPDRADLIEAYAHANGGKVTVVCGLRFITLANPQTTLDKLAIINRLERDRKRREFAATEVAMLAASKL